MIEENPNAPAENNNNQIEEANLDLSLFAENGNVEVKDEQIRKRKMITKTYEEIITYE